MMPSQPFRLAEQGYSICTRKWGYGHVSLPKHESHEAATLWDSRNYKWRHARDQGALAEQILGDRLFEHGHP